MKHLFKYVISGIVFVMFACYADCGYSQMITIEECFNKAKENYPLIKQHDLIEKSKNYDINNLSKIFLPQVTLGAQATYQTETVSIPISLPGITVPEVGKDQYRVTLDVSQMIWDGGSVKHQKQVREASGRVEAQSIEVETYPIAEQVTNLYLGILMIEEQLTQLELLTKNLEVSLNTARSLKNNGMAIESDIDVLNVEILNTKQRKTEAKMLQEAYMEMLSSLINVKITSISALKKPETIHTESEINRPEIPLFQQQIKLFEAQENLIKSKNMPKFYLFAQGGYGKPGLNMLSNSFDFFGIGGLRMSWNFGNLYTKNNEKQLINLNKEKIKNREETLKFNINRQLIQVKKEMDSFRELLNSDSEIINLREKVRIASEKKYNNGVYTVNDLIKDLNAENIARQAKVMHEMQYSISVYKHKNISGNIFPKQ